MILLSGKLTGAFKSPSKPEALSASLRDFQSKITGLIAQIGSEPDSGPEKWFDLIHTTNLAFAKMVVQVDHPMTRWGERLADEYLNHTLNLLSLLNSVSASLSRLSQARASISRAAEHLIKKFPTKSPRVDLKPDRSAWIADRPATETESVLLRALGLSRGIATLSIAFVLSGLSGDAKPYMEIRKRVGDIDSVMIVKELDSRFCQEVISLGTECTSVGRYYMSQSEVDVLKTRLELLGNAIEGLEKRSNNMFYEVLATRNKLMDNLRLHNT